MKHAAAPTPLARLTRAGALEELSHARGEAAAARRRAARLAVALMEAEALLGRMQGGIVHFDKAALLALRQP